MKIIRKYTLHSYGFEIVNHHIVCNVRFEVGPSCKFLTVWKWLENVTRSCDFWIQTISRVLWKKYSFSWGFKHVKVMRKTNALYRFWMYYRNWKENTRLKYSSNLFNMTLLHTKYGASFYFSSDTKQSKQGLSYRVGAEGLNSDGVERVRVDTLFNRLL